MKSEVRYTIPKYRKHTWKALLLLLAAVVVSILRCVYGVIEFASGQGWFLTMREVFMFSTYIGDATLMHFVQAVFYFIHAGMCSLKPGWERFGGQSYYAAGPELK